MILVPKTVRRLTVLLSGIGKHYTKMATKWGICTAGKISNDFAACLASAPETEHQVVAVAARELKKAKKFAEHFGIPVAYDSYEDLANDPNIEVVYIGAIHPYHKSLSILYLTHGKHVVCEKPSTLSYQDTQEIIHVAQEKKLFWMEGCWSRFFPLYQDIVKKVKAGEIGEVKAINAHFNAKNSHVDRIKLKELGGGGLFDMGIYPVLVTNLLFKGRPESITAVGAANDQGVDKWGSIILKYSEDRVATLSYHTEVEGAENVCNIFGTKASIKIQDPFWCPTEMVINGNTLKFPLIPVKYDLIYRNSQGFHFEANAVRESLKKGELENEWMPHQDSLDIMYILTEVFQQMGLSFSS